MARPGTLCVIAVVLVAGALLDAGAEDVIDATLVAMSEIVGRRTQAFPFEYYARRIGDRLQHAIARAFLQRCEHRTEGIRRADVRIGVTMWVLAVVDVELADVTFYGRHW